MKTATLQPLKITQGFKFCPEIIFDAWIDPDLVGKWFFVGPESEFVQASINPVAGGKFSIVELDPRTRTQIEYIGVYKTLDRPSRLSFSLSVPKHSNEETTVNIEIKSQPGGCYLTLTQNGVPPAIPEKRWREMLDKLYAILKEMAKKTL